MSVIAAFGLGRGTNRIANSSLLYVDKLLVAKWQGRRKFQFKNFFAELVETQFPRFQLRVIFKRTNFFVTDVEILVRLVFERAQF